VIVKATNELTFAPWLGMLEKIIRLEKERDDLFAALKDARAQIIALCSEGDVPDSVNEAIRKAEGKP
jgi:hypothetical protein